MKKDRDLSNADSFHVSETMVVLQNENEEIILPFEDLDDETFKR